MIEWKNKLEHPLYKINNWMNVVGMISVVFIILYLLNFIDKWKFLKSIEIINSPSSKFEIFLNLTLIDFCVVLFLLHIVVYTIFLSKSIRTHTNTEPKDKISLQELEFISTEGKSTIFVRDIDCMQKFYISGIFPDELKQIQKYKNFIIKDGKIITLSNLTF